jgi:hypothetical protein
LTVPLVIAPASLTCHDRAKQFAASDHPNLLNVAVSRGRRRLYVIGDRGAWSGYPHFDLLADNLHW